MQFLGPALTNGAGAEAFSAFSPVYKTGAYTAASGEWVNANTTSAAFTVTLPASPAVGAMVRITDAAKTFATNNLTVGRNSQTIDGVAANFVMNGAGWDVVFFFNGLTWALLSSGIKSVQRGVKTLSVSGLTDTVTVSAVNMNRAVLSMSAKKATDNSLEEVLVQGVLTNSTTITFTRGNYGAAAAVAWQLVEWW